MCLPFILMRAIQGSGDGKAADTREGPGDLRSEEQMSEANRAGGRPEFKPGFAGAVGLGSLKMSHFRGRSLQINLKSLSMQAGLNSVAARSRQNRFLNHEQYTHSFFSLMVSSRVFAVRSLLILSCEGAIEIGERECLFPSKRLCNT
jgi:hypothetical protein